jgi:hypothetical protein
MIDRPEREFVAIDLPMGPFSTNDLYQPIIRAGKPALVRSKAYLAWIEEAGYRLNVQRPGRVSGHFASNIYIEEGAKDIDNCVKSLHDLLQKQGVIDNDKLCRKLKVDYGHVQGIRIMVVKTKGPR